MFRRTALVVAALAAAATVLVAAPANAAAYGVSLSVSKTSADVGTTVTLSGKVTGKSSTGRTVYLQRQSGSTWSTVTTTKTTSKSTYSKAVKIPAAGTNAYRAVVKATSTVDRGQSTTRTVTGWTWLNLAEQPHFVAPGFVVMGNSFPVAGANRTRNIELFPDDSGVNWVLDGQCDRSDVRLALYDSASSSATAQASVSTDDGGQTYTATSGALKPANNVTTSTQYLTIRRVSGGSDTVVVVSPRVHCKTSRLPNAGFLLS